MSAGVKSLSWIFSWRCNPKVSLIITERKRFWGALKFIHIAIWGWSLKLKFNAISYLDTIEIAWFNSLLLNVIYLVDSMFLTITFFSFNAIIWSELTFAICLCFTLSFIGNGLTYINYRLWIWMRRFVGANIGFFAWKFQPSWVIEI